VKQINRLGIVNRGEPAMRLLTAVADLNRADSVHSGSAHRITTVAFYTSPDADSWFVQEADEAVLLGPATFLDPRDGHRKSTYLDEAAVVTALTDASCDAVWVGWGFVSERASFAQRCEEAGIVFVGPDSATIRALGDKITAKRLAEQADVPVLPWGAGPVDTAADAAAQAEQIGYPVVLKATAGGGGRGIRVVRSPEGLAGALASARGEAELAFGDPTVFLEHYVEAARHVEVQIIADSYGTSWALGVRDCSIQRRNQKVIEESASTALSPATEAAIRSASVRLSTAAGYRNAGTVEFLSRPVRRSSSSWRSTPASRSSTRSPRRRPGSTWSSSSCGWPRASGWRASRPRHAATRSRPGCARRTPSRGSSRPPAGSRCCGSRPAAVSASTPGCASATRSPTSSTR
jgi:acetyl/propionyl-CoA carboxylase alpha subunit